MTKHINSLLSTPLKKIDPTLDALFSTSSGPAQPLLKIRYSNLITKPAQESANEDEDENQSGDEDEQDSDHNANVDNDEPDGSKDEDDEVLSADSEAEERDAATFAETQEQERRQQRHKRKQDEFHDLESKYFQKLADDDTPVTKRRKVPFQEAKRDDSDSNDDIPMHVALISKDKKKEISDEVEKAARTVFLSNVSIEAVNSKKAKKKILAHLSSILDRDASPAQLIESLRFRSVAFATAAIPKRVAYITKATMEATTHSVNAYVVYSSAAAARKACAKLNGTIVLDRHLRVDSVAHPAEVDHRRCVFVGNLGFVDDETLLNVKVDEEGKETTEKRKRTRTPMDVEEGLWRTFGEHAGKVESVRVVRDQATRVGKGIAYVQFYDGNCVESALLLEGKKFPPRLPRELRVSRCKAPHKTARAIEKKTADKLAALKASGKAGKGYVPKPTAEQLTMAGRVGKLFGHFAAAKARNGDGNGKCRDRPETRPGRPDKAGKARKRDRSSGLAPELKTLEAIIFEGRRASAADGIPKDLKMKIKGKKKQGGQKPKKAAI